jgi:hypothetical protein
MQFEWFSQFLISFMHIRDSQPFTNLPGKFIGYFSMPGDGFHGPGQWIHPERMGSTFSLEVAAIPAQMP